jgi:hypothetical protein
MGAMDFSKIDDFFMLSAGIPRTYKKIPPILGAFSKEAH